MKKKSQKNIHIKGVRCIVSRVTALTSRVRVITASY